MSDAQLTALLGGLAAVVATLAAAIRWSVNRITKALDDASAANDRNTKAMIDHAVAMNTLSLKVDAVATWVEGNTPVHGVPVINPHRSNTPPRGTTSGGYSFRPKEK